MSFLFMLLTDVLDVGIVTLFFKINGIYINKKRCFSLIPLIIILAYINTYDLSIVNYILFFLVLLYITLYVMEFNMKEGFLYSILYEVIAGTCEMVTYLTIYEFQASDKDVQSFFVFLIINETLKSICLFLYPSLKKLMQNKIYFRSVAPILILPISFFILIIGVLKDLYLVNLYVYISIVLLFLSNFVILNILVKVNNEESLRLEVDQLKDKAKINELYYELIQQKYVSSKEYMHDFNKHINVLHSLLEKNDIEVIKEYIERICDVSLVTDSFCCGNKLLDVVIRIIRKKIDTKDINFIFKNIEEMEFQNHQIYHISSIFYNVIENAMEECERLGYGTIRITLTKKDTNYIIFKVTNSSTKVDVENMKSSKQNQEDHGYGIRNIKKTVELLQGHIDFTFLDETKEFSALVILPGKELLVA